MSFNLNYTALILYNYDVLNCYYNKFRNVLCCSESPSLGRLNIASIDSIDSIDNMNGLINSPFLSFIFLFGLFASCSLMTCVKNERQIKTKVNEVKVIETDENIKPLQSKADLETGLINT